MREMGVLKGDERTGKGGHRWIYSPAMNETEFKQFMFYHGVAERRGRKAALVAAGRKLATVCYSVLVYGRPYFNPLDAQA